MQRESLSQTDMDWNFSLFICQVGRCVWYPLHQSDLDINEEGKAGLVVINFGSFPPPLPWLQNKTLENFAAFVTFIVLFWKSYNNCVKIAVKTKIKWAS